jgi:hypothetical protein
LRVGQVFYLFCDFLNRPKDKFVVVVCTNPRLLLFLFNSEIAQFIQHKSHLLRCQVSLCASDHQFLDHDSHLDCSYVVDKLTEEELIRQVEANMSRMSGELNEAALSEVLSAVEAARTISLQFKLWMIAGLKSRLTGPTE